MLNMLDVELHPHGIAPFFKKCIKYLIYSHGGCNRNKNHPRRPRVQYQVNHEICILLSIWVVCVEIINWIITYYRLLINKKDCEFFSWNFALKKQAVYTNFFQFYQFFLIWKEVSQKCNKINILSILHVGNY